MNRGDFVKIAGAMASGMASPALAAGPSPAPMGNRFLTLSIAIRTRTWEVSRDVCPKRGDESELHTPANVRALREAFRESCPGGRLTRSFSLSALGDPRPNFREIRDYAVRCHEEFGDEINHFPCYSAPCACPASGPTATSARRWRSSPGWWAGNIGRNRSSVASCRRRAFAT